MVIRLRPLAILLACAGLLGCATRPGDAGPDTGQDLPGTVQAAPVVYQIGELPEPEQAVQTGRYSYTAVGAQAAQVDPLLAVIDVRLPPDVATVEQAIHYLLNRSGFNLLPPDPGDQPVSYLLNQPLPEVHRHLGPVSLREALLTLGGKAFQVNVDYVYRKVSYQVSPDYAGGQRS
ncbi:MAG: integrating conjugative element protein pill, pfgi-1 [Candidatus Methylumidiphilus sp.]